MKPLSVLVGSVVLGVCVCSARGAASPSSAAAKSATVVEMPIPESVFNIPASPRQGRNPFFPNSSAILPAPKTNTVSVVDTAAALVLNGIASPPKRMAMINGRSFEPGEVGDVKLPNGLRVSIQCVEVRDDSVLIICAGQRRELQLRAK